MTKSSMPLRQNPLFPWLIVLAVIVVIVLAMNFKRSGPEPAPVQAEQADAAPERAARATQGSRPQAYPLSKEALRQRRAETVEKRKKVQQNVDRTQAAFAARYSRESVDAAWSGAKEAELTQLGVSDQIRQLGVEAQNLVVDCKSSMCRITGDFPTMSAGDDWITLYMNNVGDRVPMASYKYVQNPDGTVSINVYAVGRK